MAITVNPAPEPDANELPLAQSSGGGGNSGGDSDATDAWEDATVRIYYLDRGTLKQKEITLNRQEVFQEEAESLREKGATPEQIAGYTLPPENFRARVLRIAASVLINPYFLDPNDSETEFRILSPTAVKEVTVYEGKPRRVETLN